MKNPNLVVIIFLLSIFCILNFLGCTAFQKKDSGMGPMTLEPAVALKFPDIPVPAGFRIVTKDSYSFESAGVRVGVLKYQGKANPDQVVVFYKEQMPMYNWNLLNVVEYGERLLNFDRDNETCIINMLNKGNAVTLTLSIGPKAQISPKKAGKPVK